MSKEWMAKTNVYEAVVIVLLRLAGIATLTALPTAFLPEEWMAATHQFLGLGEFPRGSIVTYMARSLSLMYALLGAFTWLMSTDVSRYRPMIKLWCIAHVVLGGLLLLIDSWSQLPLYWTLGEGIPVALAGVVVWVILDRVPIVEWKKDV